MRFPPRPFALNCPNCQDGILRLDDSAFDKSCQGKHVFLFVCGSCQKYTATAMNNIPVEEWEKFIPSEHLEAMVAEYRRMVKLDR
ncbi:MAG: hypothetical protein Kow006_22840 [Gammaproteobacteria bacterium]